MDWFERLTGFLERGYRCTQAQLEVEGSVLRSKVNGREYGIGEFEVVALKALRERVEQVGPASGRARFSNVSGDVRRMHGAPENAGALFQVASQFNMLEMVGPSVTPEQGVTRYAHDHTQGPACAIAAGAATIYRNYFAPVAEQIGQTRDRQLDGLEDLNQALASRLGRCPADLCVMQNGYALCTADGLSDIARHLQEADERERDELRGALKIGFHRQVEVTDGTLPGHRVSQAFCSALPVSYSGIRNAPWGPFATLVLEAAYEATLLEAVLQSQAGGSNVVDLTRLGGGAFGNADAWIDQALKRSLNIVKDYPLDIRMVSYGAIPNSMRDLETD